ncbi:MAG: DUF624 domain-containing protein [Clostridiaceae bacterium]|nr:DUF624 domain-containing protein [Clostridiaceae bacterium]
MAGFFGLFDYTREGPGVPKDAPPKSRFRIFFEVLGRKFWNIVKINLLFGLFNIPALVFLGLFAGYLQGLYSQHLDALPENSGDILLFIIIPLMSILVCLPIITVGPAQAGMTYVLRNYSREEHAFIWGDFKEHALKNLKQSIIVSIINTVFTVIVFVAFYIYQQMSINIMLKTAATSFIVISFLIFMMMSMYIYPMMVTFDLTIRQLYKNAFLFAIMKFFPNLLIVIVVFALLVLSFYNPIIGYIMFILITMGLTSYITNFYVYSKIEKYMIRPVEEAEDSSKDENETESIFSDKRILDEDNRDEKS